MSKTVDDLREAYSTAYQTKLDSYDYDETLINCIAEAERAGIAAVIRALRDEMSDPSTFKSAKPECCGRGVPNHNNTAEECCCQPDAWILHEEMLVRINVILGDAGAEKVGTHGSPELDEDARKLEAMGQDPGMTLEELLAPATDPAPAVCVWTQDGWEYRTAGCNGWSAHIYSPKYSPPGNKCPHCKAPIKFTEGKT